MKINYNGLWKILIDNDMKKQYLSNKVSLSPPTISKIGKGDFVGMKVLYRIAKALDIYDIYGN